MAPHEHHSYICLFSEITATDIPKVGGKGANLGEMTHAGLPVPPGFCLTADAYRAFTQSAQSTVHHILDEINIQNPEDVEIKTEQIRRFLQSQTIPPEIEHAALENYHRLSTELGLPGSSPVPVAIRSSATAEDLPTASFAGQQDTYLNIRGDEQLLENCRRCWASLWTARAVTYRVKQGFEHEKVALAIVVQAMVQSEVSGILFTANPVTGDRDQIVINASWGLGEAIVSGVVNPDTFTVNKSDHKIVEREIGAKEIAIEYSPDGGTIEKPVPTDRRNVPALSDAGIAELAALGKRIEQHYKAPMDIEWGYARGRFYILQARPITTLAQAPALPPIGEFDRSMFLEIFPDPLTPAFLSVIEPLFRSMLDYTFRKMGFTPPPHDMQAIGFYYNQPYFRTDYIMAALRPLHSPFRERLAALMVHPFRSHTEPLGSDNSIAFVRMIFSLLGFMVSFPSRLPGIVRHYHKELDSIRTVPLDNLSDGEIIVRMRELVFGTLRRLLDYDFMMIILIGVSNQVLGSWLQRYFGKESDEVRSKLISGVTGNVTMETNKSLWDLAQMAKTSPTVRATLRSGSPDMRARLQQTKEGNRFLKEMDRFLADYGHREVKMDILYPTWVEDPTPVLAFVRRYLDVPENQSPHQQQERLVKQREELGRTVKARMQRGVFGNLVAWPLFRVILKLTQAHTRERDTMHFEWTRVFPPFRRYLLELGRRWTAQELISEPEDVFFLTLDEMTEIAKSPRPMQDTAARRRAELERSRARPAPPKIRDGAEVWQDNGAQASAGAGEFHGVAGSPGVIRGVARVIRAPEEFDKLQSGEILVAPLTNPVWTPLFAIAGGLVTEVGGILSHGAIVAREYGIPAVMAVSQATQMLKDGQWVTVDGNKGIVHVDQTPPS